MRIRWRSSPIFPWISGCFTRVSRGILRKQLPRPRLSRMFNDRVQGLALMYLVAEILYSKPDLLGRPQRVFLRRKLVSGVHRLDLDSIQMFAVGLWSCMLYVFRDGVRPELSRFRPISIHLRILSQCSIFWNYTLWNEYTTLLGGEERHGKRRLWFFHIRKHVKERIGERKRSQERWYRFL